MVIGRPRCKPVHGMGSGSAPLNHLNDLDFLQTHPPRLARYKQAGKNMDKPMPVLVFDTSDILYACRFGADEVPNYREVRNLEDCPGLWWGPVDVPG